jgi:uncharacterized coiled-coil protein SlyX
VQEQESKAREQGATITELKSAITQQQTEIKALTVSLKEQASQIQKVSGQLELTKLAPQLVANGQ